MTFSPLGTIGKFRELPHAKPQLENSNRAHFLVFGLGAELGEWVTKVSDGCAFSPSVRTHRLNPFTRAS